MRIKNWRQFQHFKDRTPPWIKLHKGLLDDPDWHNLDAECSKILVMLWLIASEDPEMNGALPDIRKLSFRLRIEENRLKKVCIKLSHYLDHDDINVISPCYTEERRGETETETEKEARKRDSFSPKEALVALGVPEAVADDYLALRKKKRADLTQTALSGIENQVKLAGWDMASAIAYCCERGWQSFNASWVDKIQKPSTKDEDMDEEIDTPSGRMTRRVWQFVQRTMQ